jgi:lipopolysaccharide/colanic/teichoic acid biosynthesis glycosyltransferase
MFEQFLPAYLGTLVLGVLMLLVLRGGLSLSEVRRTRTRRENILAFDSPRQVGPYAANLSANRVRAYVEWKSWVEAAVAAALLLLLSPLLVFLSILIKLTSPGPVFYGDIREGLRMRSFRCWSFRTMSITADSTQRALAAALSAGGPQFKMTSDPRITLVGRWLRKWNLDDLPQLFNVLRREMSFVGPRPSPLRENQISASWREARLSVRPGITGLWQVCRSGKYEGDFFQWFNLDLLYAAHASFWVDARIVLATIFSHAGRRTVNPNWILPESVPFDFEEHRIRELFIEEFSMGRLHEQRIVRAKQQILQKEPVDEPRVLRILQSIE